MHASSRLLSARAHTPLIHFIGKRAWPSIPEAQHAHPAAPTELKKSFDEFVKRMKSAMSETSRTSSIASGPVYEEFWEAPSKYWAPRALRVSEDEMDAVLSGGASLH